MWEIADVGRCRFEAAGMFVLQQLQKYTTEECKVTYSSANELLTIS